MSQKRSKLTYRFKYNKLVNIILKKEANSQIQKRTSGYQWGEGRGKGQYRGKGLSYTPFIVIIKY